MQLSLYSHIANLAVWNLRSFHFHVYDVCKYLLNLQALCFFICVIEYDYRQSSKVAVLGDWQSR